MVRVLDSIGKEQVLAQRAYQPLSQEERERAFRALARVQATKVPGWDG
jgi:hypothetical protein